MSVLPAALGYVIWRGWKIFPVRFGTKRSHKAARYSGGRLWGMSDDPMEIERDFRRWPGAGVGIPTGEVNRIFVLEADTVEGHGVNGLAGLEALEVRHGLLPATLMAESPSGSIHRYFNWPGKEIKNSVGKLARGVDVKGDGGMVVAPPTRTQTGVYRWLNNRPIADAPLWVIERALRPLDRPSGLLRAFDRRRWSTPKTNRKPATDAHLNDLMEAIPNDDATDWEEWCRIGMAFYAATNGSNFGLWLFDEWSQKNEDKYDDVNTLEKWEAFKTSPPEVIGVGTLFYEANRAQFRAELEAWEKVSRRELKMSPW
jgi:Bifunctional DNA primase/polymerase, N-terminal/Primase C terminal 2 (PriCT-2)